MVEGRSDPNPVQFKALDDGDFLGPARQRFGAKHQVVLQCCVPWQAAKAVPEPRPTNLGPSELFPSLGALRFERFGSSGSRGFRPRLRARRVFLGQHQNVSYQDENDPKRAHNVETITFKRRR